MRGKTQADVIRAAFRAIENQTAAATTGVTSRDDQRAVLVVLKSIGCEVERLLCLLQRVGKR